MLPSPGGHGECKGAADFDGYIVAEGNVSAESSEQKYISGRRRPTGRETAPFRRRRTAWTATGLKP